MIATHNTVTFTNAIVARFSDEHGPLAVLRTDDEHPTEVQAVALNKNEVITLPIEAYRKTERVSKDDMSQIRDLYARFANVPEAVVMERQGYKKKKAAEIPSRLVQVDEKTGDVKVDQKVADETASPDEQKVIQHIIDKGQKGKRKYVKKSQYWNGKITKTRKPKNEAQSIAQKARVEKEIQASSGNMQHTGAGNSQSVTTFPNASIEAANEVAKAQSEYATSVEEIIARAVAKAVAETLATLKAA